MKNRNVFLFGAGAAISWNGPKTDDLTKLICEIGFDTVSGTKITKFIYDVLIQNGYSENDINFETIINVVEELNIYYSNYDSKREKPLQSLLSCFLSSNFEEELSNFSIKGGEQKHGYELEIPNGKDYEFARPANHNEMPKQHFFQHLLGILLSNISNRVSNYAYHTKGHSVINFDQNESINFGNWMERLSKENVLRLYTANYDRNFKVLMERKNISVFEGFDCGEYVNSMKGLRADIPRILQDFDSHVHYNIHGSAFWIVKDLDENQLPNPEIVLIDFPDLQINSYPLSIQIEKGRTLLATNIVTGYQKAQRAILTPFRQMQAAFDRDCCFADTIYVVGYSFGDEHINLCIKNALRYNKNLKIVIIEPSFIKWNNGEFSNHDYFVSTKIFSYRNLKNLKPTKISENLYSYFDGDVLVHTVYFSDFLAVL